MVPDRHNGLHGPHFQLSGRQSSRVLSLFPRGRFLGLALQLESAFKGSLTTESGRCPETSRRE